MLEYKAVDGRDAEGKKMNEELLATRARLDEATQKLKEVSN